MDLHNENFEMILIQTLQDIITYFGLSICGETKEACEFTADGSVNIFTIDPKPSYY